MELLSYNPLDLPVWGFQKKLRGCLFLIQKKFVDLDRLPNRVSQSDIFELSYLFKLFYNFARKIDRYFCCFCH